MAIRERALKKLNTTKHHVLRAMRAGSKAALGEVCQDLTEIRDLYREGLSQQNYATYGEICDGLILAARKMMEDGEENFQEDVFALCQELLEHLERETAKETRFKKEIFFLPYKLSMWDSLESVWRAADKDTEHCVAYVMPIPYADRNPDQTVAAWNCERDQFPKDVPTLDWQQVDLKAWHPDIIVYHSPYDNCNAVTSVDERYYSRNLKFYADKLVYIPYFVLDEIEPGNEATEESIAHFITAPGVLNADLIVVQSEKMRQVYINVLARHTNQGEEYWKKHVSGAGSPKIDKVLTSKKEDFEMPEKWRNLVDGRKVILYNTSLSAMLQNSDKVCDKLRYVFDVFRNRDDVMLWWRPHPLMKATFHSMRPQFEEEYLSMEKQYIEEGWGIYDDSPDLHRAICWSDAYYGDESSVMTLYRKTEKLTLLQTLVSGEKIFVYFGKPVTDGKKMWYIPESYPVLVEIDVDDGNVSGIFYLPLSNGYQCGLYGYRNLEKIGDKLYAIPINYSDSTKAVIEFDTLTHEFREIQLPHDLLESRIKIYQKGTAFYCTSQNGHYIYMYGTYATIIRFNVETQKFDLLNRWEDKFKCEMRTQWFMNNGVFKNGVWFLPIFRGGSILKFDTVMDEFEICDIEGAPNDYEILAIRDNILWLMSTEHPEILVYDIINKNFRRYKIRHPKIRDGVRWGKAGMVSDDIIWILPYCSDVCITIYLKNAKIEENQLLPTMQLESFENIFRANYPGYMCKDKEKIFAIHPELKKLVVLKGRTIACKILEISDGLREKLMTMIPINRQGNMYQEINFDNKLEDFLAIVSGKPMARTNGSICGNKIYDTVINW